MVARYQSPAVGRFISVDPVYWSAGNNDKLIEKTGLSFQKYLENPQHLNSYSYTINNPLKHVDEKGEFLHIIVGAGVGLAGQYVSDVVTNIRNDGFNTKAFTSNLSSKKEYSLRAAQGAAVAGTGGLAAGPLGLGVVGTAVTMGGTAVGTDMGVDVMMDRNVDYGDATINGLITTVSGGIVKSAPGVPGRLPNFGTKAFFAGEHTQRSLLGFCIDTASEFTSNMLGDFFDALPEPQNNSSNYNNTNKNEN